MSQKTLKIVIIGAGASGTLVCAQILRQAGEQDIQISWVGNQTSFALGLAYGTREIEHLLNVRIQGMSAFPSEPLHLIEWMKGTHPEWNIEKAPFIPRMYFGEYLRSLVPENDSRVKRYPDEAIRIDEKNGGYQVITENGETLAADEVVLAMGNLRANSRAGAITPVELLQIPRQDLQKKKILLVGTGLTMFDTAISLKKMDLEHPVTAISRRGLIPRPHRTYNALPSSSARADSPFFEHLQEALVAKSSIARALRVFRQECQLAEKSGSDWGAVFDLIRPKTQFYWREMSPELRARFAKHLKPYWDVHRHRVAPEIDDVIQGMVKSGRLKIRKQRASREFTSQFDIHVDCAGFANDIRSAISPLVCSLIQKDLVELDRPSLSFHTHPKHPHIHVTGPLLKGLLWETIAIPEIRILAEQLARQITATGL